MADKPLFIYAQRENRQEITENQVVNIRGFMPCFINTGTFTVRINDDIYLEPNEQHVVRCSDKLPIVQDFRIKFIDNYEAHTDTSGAEIVVNPHIIENYGLKSGKFLRVVYGEIYKHDFYL